MSKPNNLGKYLHPKKGGYEGSPADRRQDAKGERDTGMSPAEYENSTRDRREDSAGEAGKRPAKMRQAPRELSAEERFYRSATPAPVKGIRGSYPT